MVKNFQNKINQNMYNLAENDSNKLDPFLKNKMPSDELNLEEKMYLKKVLAREAKKEKARDRISPLLLGFLTGYISGFLTIRMGKFVAFGIGLITMLFQIAHEHELIDINWEKLIENINECFKKNVEDKNTSVNKIIKYFRKSTTFTTSFFSGFLVGLGGT